MIEPHLLTLKRGQKLLDKVIQEISKDEDINPDLISDCVVTMCATLNPLCDEHDCAPEAANLLSVMSLHFGAMITALTNNGIIEDNYEYACLTFMQAAMYAQKAIVFPNPKYKQTQAESKAILAQMHTFGVVDRDQETAHRIFLIRIGKLVGVKDKDYQKDHQLAFELNREAANDGIAIAYKALAEMYYNGNGTHRSLQKAFSCISDAHCRRQQCAPCDQTEIENLQATITREYCSSVHSHNNGKRALLRLVK